MKIHIFRVSFRSSSNLFRSSSSTSPFISVFWASSSFCDENEEVFSKITWFFGDSNKRSLLKLLVSSGTENKSVILFFFFTDSQLLLSLFFSPQTLRDRTLVLELRRYELDDEGSWWISESSCQFQLICTIICWIKLRVDMNLMNFEVLRNGKGFCYECSWEFFWEFWRLIFDDQRENLKCVCWVVKIWVAWQWLEPFIGCQVYYWTNRNLTPRTGLEMARPCCILDFRDLCAILKNWGTNLQKWKRLKG